ncbi:ribonuclease III [Sneathiella chinensis]|uniref:Ribonuclease 3 n=1 Tax=Sneathiella chinensis TaxID=349750 RepID=A0ABQ5U7V5_9PROT|nr:ribonuclease III [Sneathiella chinensis]GLQ07359.1 ribonuclease 3 [Sneathiella chinensis]
MSTEVTDLKPLMVVLGHRFAAEELLAEALTHTSMTKGRKMRKKGIRDFERLEFLGDRVLGLVIAEELFRRYPHAEAGQLSRRFNAQVRKETLAEIARDLDIGAYLRMSVDLATSGGRDNPAILEDCVEALIAALYLDGGMEAASQFIRDHWWKRFDFLEAAEKDPKSSLQEWAAKRGKAPPVYEVIKSEGPDHNPTFTVEVTLEGVTPCRAVGASKRVAEQGAAEKMLKDQLNG